MKLFEIIVVLLVLLGYSMANPLPTDHQSAKKIQLQKSMEDKIFIGTFESDELTESKESHEEEKVRVLYKRAVVDKETKNVSNEQAIDQYNALEVDRNETSNKVDHAEDKCNRYLRKYIHFN